MMINGFEVETSRRDRINTFIFQHFFLPLSLSIVRQLIFLKYLGSSSPSSFVHFFDSTICFLFVTICLYLNTHHIGKQNCFFVRRQMMMMMIKLSTHSHCFKCVRAIGNILFFLALSQLRTNEKIPP